MTILERYQNSIPTTGQAKLNGKDTTPIGDDNPRGEFSPSQDLANDESRLSRARGGNLTTKPYSDSVIGNR